MAMTAENAMRQATSTAEFYLIDCMQLMKIHGLEPKKYPEVLAAMIQASASDYNTAVVGGYVE